MRLTHDPRHDVAYLRLRGDDEHAISTRSAPVSTADGPGLGLVLDFDAEGRLVGIEFLSASSQLRESVLATAERPA